MSNMELLAPAGNIAALHAAVQSGADAVYLGGPKFNARQSADNFSIEDIKKYTDYCHLYGVDVHVTLNTLIKEKELSSLIDYAYSLNDAGVDTLIVQDMGAARLIKNIIPDMTLHASTQMTVTSLEGVKYLEDMGFSRVVLACELSAGEIEYICKNTNAEIEVFVHGAICMCYSGQCLMSSILGGRSGNRGRCAQPCRLSYDLFENGKSTDSGYILSPKDMALINDLRELRNIGVSSLKIEGRLKRAEYVSAVVGIYRKYLDSPSLVSKRDMRELTDAFSRTGFTNGYFKGELGKAMMSHKNPSNAKVNTFSEDAKQRADINSNIRKIPINIAGTLKYGTPLEITMYTGDTKYGFAQGTLNAEKAINKPLDKERVKAQLLKLGDTPFEAEDITLDIDEGITVPIKEINAVRREAAAALMLELSSREIGRKVKAKPQRAERTVPDELEITVLVQNTEQAMAAVKNGIKLIYAPEKIVGDIKNMSSEVTVITRARTIFCDEEITSDGVLVSSPAAICKYSGKELYGDFRLNIFNSQTANHYAPLKRITLSPELNISEIRSVLENTDADVELIAYGRIPLMIMKNCPIKAMGKCQHGRTIYKLRDRKKEEFPIICGDGCIAELINSKPIFMADKINDLKKLKINSIRLIFTVEKFEQCDKIINVYKSALSGGEVLPPAENSFTRGHYYRGVE
ncbi:MAG: U32 family peptidase [Oscillospiraceae bacterium]|nr:U32 family peptidase [Oscillospiraceae bacterium]